MKRRPRWDYIYCGSNTCSAHWVLEFRRHPSWAVWPLGPECWDTENTRLISISLEWLVDHPRIWGWLKRIERVFR